MGIKRCPKCGSAKLLAKKITGVQVESLDNGEFQINAEGKNYQIEIAGCAKCKADFNESALVELVQCKKCGKYTMPENLDSNGECDICNALAERPDLANMSKEDIIRMMLKLEKATNATTTQTVQQQTEQPTNIEESSISETAAEKMKAAQEAINNASNNFSKEIIESAKEELEEIQKVAGESHQVMNPPEEMNETEAVSEKPKRGRKPRKKTDSETSNVQENEDETTVKETPEVQVEQSANEIAELQEAPFPEQDTEMKEMFNETVSKEQNTEPLEQTPSSPFQMFDEEQSF